METNNNRILTRTFLQLMLVNILMGLVQPCNQLVDSILTGNSLGLEAMEAFSLFFPVGGLVIALGSVFSIGVQINCSHMLGSGKFDEIKGLLKTAFTSAVVFSLVFAVLLFVFSSQVSVLIGAKEEVAGQIGLTSEYLRGYSVGIPAIFLMNIMLSLMQLEGKKNIVILLTVSNLIVNAAGDIANILVFKKGLFGMAFATSAANITVFLILLIYFLFFSKMFRFSLSLPVRKYLKAILHDGFPSLSYFGSIVVRAIIFNYLIINNFGQTTLAVMLVVNSFTTIVDATIGGTGDAVLLVGGVLFGEKDILSQRRLIKTAVIAGGVLLLAITVFSAVAAIPIAELFSDNSEPEFVLQTARAIRITALCFVPDVIACVLKKYIQSVGRAAYTSVTNILSNVVYICSAAFVLTYVIGVDGLFFSFLVCYLLTLVTHIVYAFYLSRKSRRRGADIFLYLPEDYDVLPEDIYEYGISTETGCFEASKWVNDICKAREIDSKRTMFISLFVEEMTVNTVRYGFRPGKNNYINLKLIFLGDKVLLNIKDNCLLFDPKSYFDKLDEKDSPESGVGIRIIMRLSKKVVYTNSFNINNLLVEV